MADRSRNNAKGQRCKLRTKQYLEARGYHVAFLERMIQVFTPRGRMFIKKDQLGADLLAVSAGESLHVQCKYGDQGIAPAIREFGKYPCPIGTRQVVLRWQLRASEPEWYDVTVLVAQNPKLYAPRETPAAPAPGPAEALDCDL